MGDVTILFSTRPWNPVSWLIRWALPASRFKWARASHSMIAHDGYVIHATMLRGVVREPFDEALRGQRLVTSREYTVPDLEAGLEWAKAQVGKPYDFKGAFGLALDPNREWNEDDSWFCHELVAGFLNACGKKVFDKYGHVTDTSLLLINPS